MKKIAEENNRQEEIESCNLLQEMYTKTYDIAKKTHTENKLKEKLKGPIKLANELMKKDTPNKTFIIWYKHKIDLFIKNL